MLKESAMRNLRYLLPLPIIGVFIITAMLPAAVSAAEDYNVDTAHSYVLFRVKHLGIGYSYGRFNGLNGSMAYDEADPSNNAVTLQVESKNVDTFVSKRDNHLRSADFFHVEKYPAIRFQSRSFEKVDDDAYRITGDLTLMGRTRTITAEAVQTGAGKDPWGNFRRGFETQFSINRSEFGMDYMLSGVSDQVDITVSIEVVRK